MPEKSAIITGASVTHHLQIPGAGLAVEITGAKPSVAFLHGFGGNLHTWDALFERLPAGQNCLRYDLRGFGQSVAQSDAAFSHADDLLALLDMAGIERCDLTGLSMGGSIAINFALQHPHRVRSLSLISPGLTGWAWSSEWRALWRPIVAAARGGRMDEAKALWLAHPLFEPARESCGTLVEEEIAAFSGAQWVEDFERPALPDIDRLHALDLPILLLTGGRDVPDFRLIADLIAAAAPHVTRHDAPALGHMLHIEAPVECSENLTRFWRDLDRADLSANTA